MSFEYREDGYTMYPEKFQRTPTRRGVTTVCDIFSNGHRVAVLYDTPEQIVARVELNNDAADRAVLVKAARHHFGVNGALSKNPSEAEYLSEYLRNLTMKADEAYLEYSATLKDGTDGWFLGALAYMVWLDRDGALKGVLEAEAAGADCRKEFVQGYAEMQAAYKVRMN